jgi:hypothetical protein
MNRITKLSRLQHWILAAAMANEKAGTGPVVRTSPSAERQVHLSREDVLIGYFGFSFITLRRRRIQPWDIERIGRRRYQSAQASCTRAIRRLQERGLIKLHREGALELIGPPASQDQTEAANV